MSDEILRYTDLAAIIQMARAHGWPTERIVREMSMGLPYSEARDLARKAAPLLDITVSEFMRLRKKRVKSGLFQLGQKPFAVTVFPELFVIHPAIFRPHITLEGAQQIIRGMIQQFSLALSSLRSSAFHASIFLPDGAKFNCLISH